jgi:hypothetical protein
MIQLLLPSFTFGIMNGHLGEPGCVYITSLVRVAGINNLPYSIQVGAAGFAELQRIVLSRTTPWAKHNQLLN